jgi:catechol 2,3-dioxygenase-like lactoylglutathione lyase family enzyme
MFDHVTIQCADVLASAAFYDAVLAPLGGGRVMDFGEVVGYGDAGRPEFWIGPQSTGAGFRESHLAFRAASREAVREFFAAHWCRGRDPA